MFEATPNLNHLLLRCMFSRLSPFAALLNPAATSHPVLLRTLYLKLKLLHHAGHS
jgi:hypothetical protein